MARQSLDRAPRVSGRALSPKQQAFVAHYAACGNATEAARRAGYSEGRARVIGSENLTKPAIQVALAALTEKVASERIADVIERQEFWTALMRGEKGGDPEMLKLSLKASELLGKAQQDFIDRKELTGANGAPLTAPDVQVVFVHAPPPED